MNDVSDSGRLYNCARCGQQVLICSTCDRGNRYCFEGCSQKARGDSVRRAGKVYQSKEPGAKLHARRQEDYRERQSNVTHHGSDKLEPHAMLAESATPAYQVTSDTVGTDTMLPGRVAVSCGGCGRMLDRSLDRLEKLGGESGRPWRMVFPRRPRLPRFKEPP